MRKSGLSLCSPGGLQSISSTDWGKGIALRYLRPRGSSVCPLPLVGKLPYSLWSSVFQFGCMLPRGCEEHSGKCSTCTGVRMGCVVAGCTSFSVSFDFSDGFGDLTGGSE